MAKDAMRLSRICMITLLASLSLGCDESEEETVYQADLRKTYELLQEENDWANIFRCSLVIQLVFTQEGINAVLNNDPLNLAKINTFSNPIKIYIFDNEIKWGDPGLSAILYADRYISFRNYDDTGHFRFTDDRRNIEITKKDIKGNKFKCNIYVKKIR